LNNIKINHNGLVCLITSITLSTLSRNYWSDWCRPVHWSWCVARIRRWSTARWKK